MRPEVSFSALVVCFMALAARGNPSTVPPQPAALGMNPAQFMSAVQIAIDETTPELTQRSQRVVREQFAHALEGSELRGRPYETRTLGNEVIFYFVTPDDMRVPIQNAVYLWMGNIDGRVRGRGRTSFYRAPLTQPLEASLETAVSDEKTKIVSITAQSAPLRDLLKQLKTQLRSFSYVIPGECADRKVDWNFATAPEQAKPVDAFMSELAALFRLNVEKRNGTHILSGACQGNVVEADSIPAHHRPNNLQAVAHEGFFPVPAGNGNQFQRVYFPVPPIGYY